jgi:tripartite-type tricarboxylate transporter receptor subunit TctC
MLGTAGILAVNPALSRVRFDSVKDFAPISLTANLTSLLAVHPSLKVKTARELIALAKSKPGKLNYASSGNGTPYHMAGELFKLQTGTEMTHVPYRGSAPALTDLLAGHVDLMFDNLTNVISHIEGGKILALGVAGAKRTPYLPNVPAIAEFVPGFEATTWVGFLLPAKTPDDIVHAIARDCDEVLRDPAIIDRVKKLAAEPVGGSPAQFATFLKADVERWKNVVKAANLKVE